MLRFQEHAAEVMRENIHPEAHAGLARSLTERRDWREHLSDPEAAAVWTLVGRARSGWDTAAGRDVSFGTLKDCAGAPSET